MPVIITVRARPGSSRQKMTIDAQGIIKIFVVSQPEKGKANEEIISFLAKALSCAKKEIIIVSGLTSKTKKIKLSTIDTEQELFTALKLDRQTDLH
jgi:uncharacterized protein (TIGR00251 family)